MRRIPRPLWAIDPLAPLHSSTASSCTHLRSSTAAFSSTATKPFLLPAKQDKKKHQQFVRRWQKRLLGDSEPIGAHVDPYDPTSPVRIAPEEQGEYEEVLDNANATRRKTRQRTAKGPNRNKPLIEYLPAQEGERLMHVGGDEWLQKRVEGDMAREFEKLTMQTYTPMTLDMANDIEALTGTPYTLRDDNLLMAQTVHQVTNRPYTRYNFGLHTKPRTPEEIRARFTQAVAEVYALKEAGLDMDLAKSSNQGIYDIPRWVKDIKLYKTDSGELALAYPAYKTADDFIQAIQTAPEWESVPEFAPAEQDELLVEERPDLLEPVLPVEPVPTMDPATPDFKRAAVVKLDSEKKPFDFMSNRPVPRTKPVEAEKVEETFSSEELSVNPPSPVPSRLAELMLASQTSQTAVNGLRHTVLEHRAHRIANEIAALQSSIRLKRQAAPSAAQVEEVKWRHVPIPSLDVKFALFKRIYQLTGLHISDPNLSSSETLGDLYGHLRAAAKPKATTLYSAIHIEAQKARDRAKRQSGSQATSRRRADLGDLIRLGNVQLRQSKPTKTELRERTGMEKVVKYALWERGLLPSSLDRGRDAKLRDRLGVVEGSRDVPRFGKPLSNKGANYLAERTRERRQRVEAKAMRNKAMS